ncbi:MAG: hypothetical protein OXC96_09525 [Cyanobacteria bacterium MAG CAR1_bin_15]|nr:hypothetical protein [Cyanobacteria bacterium MAG CAR1_bin_15]
MGIKVAPITAGASPLFQDSRDIETGFGMEIGAAIAWHDPQHGISAQLQGRSLVARVEEEFRQQGMALSYAWEPQPTQSTGDHLSPPPPPPTVCAGR